MKKLFKLSLCSLFTLFLSFSLFAQNTTSKTSTTVTNSKGIDGSTNSVTTTTTAQRAELSADDLVVSVQLAMSNPNYMVTPGDIYNLSYAAGSTPISYDIAVDSSYKVRVSNLAVIDAKGKTFPELKATVENIVSKNYPMSGVQFVLTNPSTFKVIITGEVKKTIEANAWSLSRLSSFIDYGEDTEFASHRFVTITSSDSKQTTYDLFQATRHGDFSQDPYVRPGDVITLNRIGRSIEIKGAVERSGNYELKDGENLKELIEYYGNGLAPLADTSRIEVTRFVNEENTSGKKIYLNKEGLDQNFTLMNLDQVYISDFTTLSPVVFFEGAVMTTVDTDSAADLNSSQRATINLNENTNYGFLIRDNKRYFVNPQADLQNAYIIRGLETFRIDIEKILYDPSYYTDLIVQPNDKLIVPFRQFFVTVAGSVANPDRYPYIPNRTYEYYVGLAGGFDKDRNTGNAVKIIDMEGNTVNKGDFITPECTITAATNSFYFYFSRYATIITTFASVISAVVGIKALFMNQ